MIYNKWPYTEFKEVTCTDTNGYAHPMVKFPKFYYKRTKHCGGLYDGNDAWIISRRPKDGYHVHPAFMYQGNEQDYICIGKYILRGSNPYMQTRTGDTIWYSDGLSSMAANCKALGNTLHLWTVYELFVMQLLFLIETKNPDWQYICATEGQWKIPTTSDNWHGISEISDNVQWVDGIKSDLSSTGTSNWVIYDNKGNFRWTNTNFNESNTKRNYGIKPFFQVFSNDWDLEDTFVSQSPGYNSQLSPFGCDEYTSSWDGNSGLTLAQPMDNGSVASGLFAMNMSNNLGSGYCGRLASFTHD